MYILNKDSYNNLLLFSITYTMYDSTSPQTSRIHAMRHNNTGFFHLTHYGKLSHKLRTQGGGFYMRGIP